MGTPADTSLVLSGAWESPDSTSNPASPAPPDSGRSLDLQMAGLEMQKSLLDVQLSERERLPAVNLTGDAGLLSSVDNLRLPAGERTSGVGYSLGVQVELPLFTWGSIGLRIEQRRLAAEAQQLRLQQLARARRTELLSVTARLATVKTAVQLMRGTLRSAEDAYLLTKSRFAGGAALSLEVLSAQQLLADTRVAFLHALAEWHGLKAKLSQLTAQ
ncbi:MAG TPA: TolC family protein, partial [Bacteroidota bacterium]